MQLSQEALFIWECLVLILMERSQFQKKDKERNKKYFSAKSDADNVTKLPAKEVVPVLRFSDNDVSTERLRM